MTQLLTVLFILLFSMLVCAQTGITPKPKTAQIDSNKFAVIINGAGGEEEYAKQFEKWTKDLTTALTQKYGFDPNKLRVLTEKPADANALRSTAEEVKRTFSVLKTELHQDNILFVFLIGHGSFDGREAKFNLVGPDLPASEYDTLLS